MKSHFLRWTSLLIILLPVIAKAAVPVAVDGFVNITDKHHVSCQEYYFFKDQRYCSIRSIQPQVSIDSTLLLAQKQKIIFDNRLWKPALTDRTRFLTKIAYFPVGQNFKNWNEMVVSHFVNAQESANIQQFMKNFVEENYINGIRISINLLDSTSGQRIYELYVHHPPTNAVETELFKITQGPDGLYVLRYVIKNASMSAENRAKWLPLLKQSEIRPQAELPPLPLVIQVSPSNLMIPSPPLAMMVQ